MLALRVIPVGSPIWKVNVLSATFGALTGGVIYILIYRFADAPYHLKPEFNHKKYLN